MKAFQITDAKVREIVYVEKSEKLKNCSMLAI